MVEGVGCLAVDSFNEMNRLNRLAAEGLEPPQVLVRITPGVEAHTHVFV